MLGILASHIRNNLKELIVSFQKFRLNFNKNAQQLTGTTKFNRYPNIFKAVREEFQAGLFTPKKILSYGCSTGEECLTLNEYFPNDIIVGTDINKGNLRKCQKRIHLPNLKFIFSDHTLLQREGPFDIIFCMSVLCRWEETEKVTDCGQIYPFPRFDHQLQLLDSLLINGGVLVIYNSNFRFSDSSIYSGYHPLRLKNINESGFVHKFDRRNQKLKTSYRDCIFKKVRPTKDFLPNTLLQNQGK